MAAAAAAKPCRANGRAVTHNLSDRGPEYEVRSTVVPREFNNTKDPGRSLAYVVQRREEDRK